MIQDVAGNIWSGTFSGTLIRQDAVTGRSAKAASLPTILRLFIDRSGRLWIGTNRGLYTIAHPEHDTVPVRVEELASVLEGVTVDIFDVCQTRSGDLWFATTNRLLLLSNGKWTAPLLLPGSRYHFKLLACDNDGGLWLAGDAPAGLWHASGDASALHLNRVVQPLLDARAILSMRFDSRGWLWMGTDFGVAVWNRSAWRFFNQASGMVWNDANQSALYEDSDASMWIGTSNGASHIKRPEILFSDSPMKVVVEGITRNGVAVDTDKPFSVPWDSSSLEFTLAVPKYDNHDALSFRYRLNGLEDAWFISANAEIRYPALSPGRYALQIIADNSALQNSSDVKEVPFEITPLWWQTHTFHAFCALLIASIIVMAYRYRVRKLLARHKLMEELVRKNQDKSKFIANAAHDLRQPMQAIGNLLEATRACALRKRYFQMPIPGQPYPDGCAGDALVLRFGARNITAGKRLDRCRVFVVRRAGDVVRDNAFAAAARRPKRRAHSRQDSGTQMPIRA